MSLEQKEERLKRVIAGCGSAVVAFSGGVDSSLVCAVAKEVLGGRVIAVTATSPTYPPEELEEAKRVANWLGIKHLVIETDEINDENFRSNPPERCYFCRGELFARLEQIRKHLGFKAILDGTNHEDLSDFRPGIKAAREFGVISPLALAGLSKQEVRKLAAKRGLPNHDKPANPCLASRIPFGYAITPQRLGRIARAERFLHGLGLKVVRVRDHGEVARLEVGRSELPKAFKLRAEIVRELKKLGYAFVALDLEGYRTGSFAHQLGLNLRSST